jgi:hypothetical protein
VKRLTIDNEERMIITIKDLMEQFANNSIFFILKKGKVGNTM